MQSPELYRTTQPAFIPLAPRSALAKYNLACRIVFRLVMQRWRKENERRRSLKHRVTLFWEHILTNSLTVHFSRAKPRISLRIWETGDLQTFDISRLLGAQESPIQFKSLSIMSQSFLTSPLIALSGLEGSTPEPELNVQCVKYIRIYTV